MKISLKKKIGAAVAAATIIGSAGVAVAFWTTTGAGTGSGSVGTSTALVLHGTAPTALYPGTSSVVNFTVDNASTGFQTVTTIRLDSVTTDKAGCSGADFSMPDVTSGQNVPAGNGTALTATGTLTMANTLVNQDACKTATLTLNLSSI